MYEIKELNRKKENNKPKQIDKDNVFGIGSWSLVAYCQHNVPH